MQDNDSLQQFCLQAATKPLLLLDTEFIRQSTLQPKLGLIQLYDGEELVLVDPLAISDWQPLQNLLANTKVTKVMHACMEDLDAFQTIGIERIAPLIDTQMAALLLGQGSSVGFAALVEQVTGTQLDKGESRTNWLARPLRDAQLTYAANDVLYLLPVYQQLQQQLSAEQYQLLLQEAEQLQLRRSMQWPDQLRFIDIKNSWQLPPRALAVLQQLVVWRLDYARSKDLALGLIFKDAQLFDIARKAPASFAALQAIPGLPERELKRHGQAVLRLVKQALDSDPAAWPQPAYHREQFAGYREVTAQIRDSVQLAAGKHQLPTELLATKRQQTEYLNWCWRVSDTERQGLPVPEVLRGWRRALLEPLLPRPEHLSDS
ncbi:ribonuclease D [Alkalimonas sp. MEB108]|uniref:Ribonuclease D n=1 Tax=Alkalimonas cellulosilytica TaxID=3058395 RepID=A0ABU7J1N4_9GAMM|nr:ribonuclease D [Alkalimonas sp. MEB108]MEE1999915.1 ribonuclease D [Alkalimonas sp. MEB108]